MNQFDFHYVTVSSTKISDLTKAGIRRDRINSTRDGYVQYGRKCFPRSRYTATVAFFDAPGGESGKLADAAQAEWRAKCPNATVSVKYHCAD